MSNLQKNFDTDNLEVSNIRLLYITEATLGSDWHSTLHSHNNLELFYVTSGEGKFYINKQSFPVSTGDLIVVNPKTLHTESSTNDTPLEYVAIGVSGVLFDYASEEDAPLINHAVYKDFYDKKKFESYLKFMVEESMQKNADFSMACQNLLQLIIILIKRCSDATFKFVPSDNISKECSILFEFINANYKKNLKLDDLADYVHMNKFYISHEFKKSYGISPINYLIKKRIDDSKNLLSKTDHSLAQISEIVGFSSPSYFSQIFKKSENISPKQFRTNASKAKKIAEISK